MKTLKLLLFNATLSTCIYTYAQSPQLPFSSSRFTALPQTSMNVIPNPLDSPAGCLEFAPISPGNSPGFSIDLSGTDRLKMVIDAPIYDPSKSSSNFSLIFSSQTEIAMSKLNSVSPAELIVNIPSDPLISFELYMDDAWQAITLNQGTIGTIELIPDSIPDYDSTFAPFLHSISSSPFGSPAITEIELTFHDLIKISITSGPVMIGHNLRFRINQSYSMIDEFQVQLSNIEYPITVYNYIDTYLPVVYTSLSDYAGPAETEVSINGANMDQVYQLTLGGIPVPFIAIGSTSLLINIPPLSPGSYDFIAIAENNYTLNTGTFEVTATPTCTSLPLHDINFFYFDGEQLNVVSKWKYNAPAVTGYEVRFKEIGAESWSNPLSVSEPEITFDNMDVFKRYEIQVRSVCENLTASYSDWGASQSINIRYEDEMIVSNKMNTALIAWKDQNPSGALPMGSFLNADTELDQREVSSVIDRFFELTSDLLPSTLTQPAGYLCQCKTLRSFFDMSVDMDFASNGTSMTVITPEQKKLPDNNPRSYLTNQRGYYDAAIFNKTTYESDNKKATGLRHSDKNFGLQNAYNYEIGDYSSNPAQTSGSMEMLVLSYLCADPNQYISHCGCAKKVYVQAESEADVCINVEAACAKRNPFFPFIKAPQEYGARAEASYNSIILTGPMINGGPSFGQGVEVKAFGNFAREKNINLTTQISSEFRQNAMDILKNSLKFQVQFMKDALGYYLNQDADQFVQSLQSNSYLENAIDDFALLGVIDPFEVVSFENQGSNGCTTAKVSVPNLEFQIILEPNKPRYVLMSNAARTQTVAWGCTYKANAKVQSKYYLTAAVENYDISLNRACCLNATGAFATRKLYKNDNAWNDPLMEVTTPIIDVIGEKDEIQSFLFRHSEKTPDPDYPGFNLPYWTYYPMIKLDVNPSDKLVLIGDIPKGYVYGKYSCKPEMVGVWSYPGTISGGTGPTVTLAWKPTISIYNTGYNIDFSFDNINFTSIATNLANHDSVYTDTLPPWTSMIYYRIRAINEFDTTASDYTDTISVALPPPNPLHNTVGDIETNADVMLNLRISPNSFREATRIIYTLSSKTEKDIQIELYDISGKLIKELVPVQKQTTGMYIYELDSRQLSPGTYIVTLKSGKNMISKRIIKE